MHRFGRPASPGFLVGGVAGAVIVASAISLTNFVRHPEISGRAATVEAHYETVEQSAPSSLVAKGAAASPRSCDFSTTIQATSGSSSPSARLDVFFWMYLRSTCSTWGEDGWASCFVSDDRQRRGDSAFSALRCGSRGTIERSAGRRGTDRRGSGTQRCRRALPF